MYLCILGNARGIFWVSLRILSMPGSLMGGGTIPLSASVNCFAACTTASSGNTVGDMIYLCLKTSFWILGLLLNRCNMLCSTYSVRRVFQQCVPVKMSPWHSY